MSIEENVLVKLVDVDVSVEECVVISKLVSLVVNVVSKVASVSILVSKAVAGEFRETQGHSNPVLLQ